MRAVAFMVLARLLAGAGPPPGNEPPLRYCLAYTGGADSIRLAQSIEMALIGDSGTARATAFPLDARHTPGLLATIGAWRRRGDGTISITFGGTAWRYIYDVRLTEFGLAGDVRVQTDMHLDRAMVWRVAGRRCARARDEDSMRVRPHE